jgi:PAS domain S-box-containing protein
MFNLQEQGWIPPPTPLDETDYPEEAQRRGEILEAVAFVAERFLQGRSWEEGIQEALGRLGAAAGVDRLAVFQDGGGGGTLVLGRTYEWASPEVPSRIDRPEVAFSHLTGQFERWTKTLRGGGVIYGRLRDFPEDERALLAAQGILSLLVLPIFAGDQWLGVIRFERCTEEYEWSVSEIGALRAAAGILGAAIQRERSTEALRDSEGRYRRLVELSPDAIAVHCDGKIVFANRAAARLLAAAGPEDLIGRPIMDVVHPDDWESLEELIRQPIEDGEEPPLLGQRLVRLDGVAIDVEVAGMPVTFQGKPAEQMVIRDVTDRKRAEAHLRQRHEYLDALHQTSLALMDRLDLPESLEAIVARAAALVGTSHGFVYLVAPGGKEIEVKVGVGAFSEWIGYRMKLGEGMSGKAWQTGRPMLIDDYDTWEGRSPGVSKGVFHAAVAVPLTSGTEVMGILGVAHVEEGRVFLPEEVGLLTRFADLASIALDNARLYTTAREQLAERERVERQLRGTEAKYRTLVEQIPAITYTDTVDEAMTTLYISPQVESILGYTPQEWIDDPDLWVNHVHEEDRELALAEYLRGRDSGEPFSFEYRMIARDGRVVWFRDEAVVLRDESGQPSSVHGVMFDITQRKQMEEERERALDAEREATERLRALDEMKNTFLHAVSHELRTPLSAVLGFALTLQREEVRLPAEEKLEIIRRLAVNARKLDQLLSDLLDLDRLERGIVGPKRRPTDLAALIRRTVENSDILGTRPVRVEADLVVVAIDSSKVERIVENLLANAVKHTPPGTTIWVRVISEKGGAIISVEDSGPGVPEKLRESIFQPFTRGPEAPSHAPGVGIGLSLVARFAELHGGRAWVSERPGGGASFNVYLPSEAA